jgi:predicted RNase H-like HicB family nuclease
MTVQDYLDLPYQITTRRINDESGSYYFATVQELDGCMSDGATLEEVYANIREAMEGWMETCLEAGRPVPKPAANWCAHFSGLQPPREGWGISRAKPGV